MDFQILSAETFPEVNIVQFPSTVAATEQWLMELEYLFKNCGPFVILYPIFDLEAFTSIDPEVSKVARKTMILWLKKNREIFQEKCKGILLRAKPDQSDLPIIEQQISQVESVYRVPAKILLKEDDKASMIAELINA